MLKSHEIFRGFFVFRIVNYPLHFSGLMNWVDGSQWPSALDETIV